jgi:hypothetical protein
MSLEQEASSSIEILPRMKGQWHEASFTEAMPVSAIRTGWANPKRYSFTMFRLIVTEMPSFT